MSRRRACQKEGWNFLPCHQNSWYYIVACCVPLAPRNVFTTEAGWDQLVDKSSRSVFHFREYMGKIEKSNKTPTASQKGFVRRDSFMAFRTPLFKLIVPIRHIKIKVRKISFFDQMSSEIPSWLTITSECIFSNFRPRSRKGLRADSLSESRLMICWIEYV